MLPHISNQAEYKDFLEREEAKLSRAEKNILARRKYSKAKDKMLLMEPERAHDLFASSYSHTGRSAHDPVIILRSFILMPHFGYTSVDVWVNDVKEDNLLQLLIGADKKKGVPSVGTHYGFINRLTNSDPHMNELYPKGKNLLCNKDKEDNTGITQELAEKYQTNPKYDLDRWSRKLEELYNLVIVQPFLEKLLEKNLPLKEFILSGDGTCLHIHSNPNGNRVKNPIDDQHSYRYTAPTADWGKDWGENGKHLEDYFGFNLFIISLHGYKIDVPLYFGIHPASENECRHMVTDLNRMLQISPNAKPRFMCYDKAGDSDPMRKHLKYHGIIPIIPLKKNRKKRPQLELPQSKKDEHDEPLEYISEDRYPVCMYGEAMSRDGHDNSKNMTKYRCPLKTGKVKECPHDSVCNKTAYGRVVKIPDNLEDALYVPVDYHSKQWKKRYNNRTSCERMNNRVLNNYDVQHLTCRNESKHLFFAMMAGMNVHLDAWLKQLAA